jgi:hypothetical protein
MNFTITGILCIAVLLIATPVFLAGVNLIINGYDYCDAQIISGLTLVCGSGGAIIMIASTMMWGDMSIINRTEEIQTAEIYQCASEHSCSPEWYGD